MPSLGCSACLSPSGWARAAGAVTRGSPCWWLAAKSAAPARTTTPAAVRIPKNIRRFMVAPEFTILFDRGIADRIRDNRLAIGGHVGVELQGASVARDVLEAVLHHRPGLIGLDRLQ